MDQIIGLMSDKVLDINIPEIDINPNHETYLCLE